MRHDEEFAKDAICDWLKINGYSVPKEIVSEPFGEDTAPDYLFKLDDIHIYIEVTRSAMGFLLKPNDIKPNDLNFKDPNPTKNGHDRVKYEISADTHFSHTNIIKYTGRPFASVEEMDRTLIENWNHSVKTEDQVFFLGDFGMGDVEHLQSICTQLNGNKICIRGNHDANPNRMYRIGFSVVLEAAFVKIGQHIVELIHDPSYPAPSSHFQCKGQN